MPAREVLRPLLFILVLSLPFFSSAQQLLPRGEFLSDSLKIGEPVTYSLSFRYPRNMQVIFPDSAFDFTPFEYTEKTAFPTRSDSLYSFDSAIYELTTFEIDPVQYLSLPVFLISSGDSTRINPDRDSIFLQQVVIQVPDTIVLKENTAFVEVPLDFNYPYLFIGLGGLVFIVLLILLIFGKNISRALRLRRLKREYERFLTGFDEMFSKSQQSGVKTDILKLWKVYMEKLQQIPYTRMTSREIRDRLTDPELSESLSSIDRMIYGRKDHEGFKDRATILRAKAVTAYEEKRKEIMHG